jgi:RNA polymerase sigma-70 factor (ECF subfamily)
MRHAAEKASEASRASDAALVNRARRGDARAFGLLYERHAPAVYRYLLLRSSDAELAEDLSQDVFEKAMDALGGLRDPASLRAWLMRIAHHRLVNHWSRKERRPDKTPLDALPPGAEAAEMPDHSLESRLSTEALMLRRLSEREQELLALRFAAGLPMRQIAAQLGCTEAAARQLQYRALKRLRDFANQQGLRP